MKNYHINQNSVTLPAKNGGTIALSLTGNSGRIVYRNKINSLIGILHPGIELGVDQFGNRWYIHHHYKNTHPTIEREDAFALGETVHYDSRVVNYSQAQIIERALAAWWSREEYHWLWQNCQHFVNAVAVGESKSEAIDQLADHAMFAGAIAGLMGLLTGNKTLVKIGLGAAAVGAAGKGLNRIK